MYKQYMGNNLFLLERNVNFLWWLKFDVHPGFSTFFILFFDALRWPEISLERLRANRYPAAKLGDIFRSTKNQSTFTTLQRANHSFHP